MENQQYFDLLKNDVGLNDLSWTGSQQEDLHGPEQPTPPMKSSSKRQKKSSTLEDETLVDAYLEISQDPIIGINQSHSCYWKRVYDYFHANKKEDSDRTQGSLQHRWAVIQEQVNRFCACYAQILNRNQSGMTHENKITHALVKYANEDKGKKSFGLMHCYNKLENADKWTSRLTHKKQKMSSVATSGSSSPSVFKDEATSPSKDVPTSRPIGNKRAKEALRRAKSSTTTGNSSAMETFGNMLSTREAKRQERFDLLIAMDKQIEEERLVEERKRVAIEEKKVALEEEKVQLMRMTEERMRMAEE